MNSRVSTSLRWETSMRWKSCPWLAGEETGPRRSPARSSEVMRWACDSSAGSAFGIERQSGLPGATWPPSRPPKNSPCRIRPTMRTIGVRQLPPGPKTSVESPRPDARTAEKRRTENEEGCEILMTRPWPGRWRELPIGIEQRSAGRRSRCSAVGTKTDGAAAPDRTSDPKLRPNRILDYFGRVIVGSPTVPVGDPTRQGGHDPDERGRDLDDRQRVLQGRVPGAVEGIRDRRTQGCRGRRERADEPGAGDDPRHLLPAACPTPSSPTATATACQAAGAS